MLNENARRGAGVDWVGSSAAAYAHLDWPNGAARSAIAARSERGRAQAVILRTVIERKAVYRSEEHRQQQHCEPAVLAVDAPS